MLAGRARHTWIPGTRPPGLGVSSRRSRCCHFSSIVCCSYHAQTCRSTLPMRMLATNAASAARTKRISESIEREQRTERAQGVSKEARLLLLRGRAAGTIADRTKPFGLTALLPHQCRIDYTLRRTTPSEEKQRVGFPTHVTRDDRRGVRWVVWAGNPRTRLPRGGRPLSASPTFRHPRVTRSRHEAGRSVHRGASIIGTPAQRFRETRARFIRSGSLFLGGYRQDACYQGPERWKSEGDEEGGFVCAGVTFTVLIAPWPGWFNTGTTRSPKGDDTSVARPGP